MSKLILKGVLQTFDYKSNGRIYPESVFLNDIKRMRPKMIINKINKLFGNEE